MSKDTTSRYRLTKTFVEKLQFSENHEGSDPRVTYWDDRIIGFGARVSAKTKTYIVYTRIKGRKNEQTGRPLEIRETIGRVGVMRHDDAETMAKKILEDAAIGIAPADIRSEQERQREIDKTKNISLEKILEKYLEDNKSLKDSTRKFYTDYINTSFADWKERPIRGITADEIKTRYNELSIKVEIPKREPVKRKSRQKADIENKLNDLRVIPKRIKTNGPGTANGAMRTLRALFNYTIQHYPDVMSVNLVTTKLKRGWNVLKPRESYITPDQLPRWYNTVKISSNDTMRDALLLLLFTGLRSESEGFALKWSDIDWTAKFIVFRDTKNKTTLTLPMTKQIYDILESRKHYAKKSDFVFPSEKSKSGHIEDIRKELWKANEAAKLDITPHDLRRTFTTYLHQCSVPMLTIKSLVNHISETPSSDITADYIQVDIRERKSAIRKVNRYMVDIIEGKYKQNFEEEDDF